MNAEEIIRYISEAPKKTPVKLYVKEKEPIDFGKDARVFGCGDKIVFGDYKDLAPILEANREKIADIVIENDARNSAVPLLDKKNIAARIEPGAIIRDMVEIGDNAVIMMGAILNIGAVVGEGTMIDMGAVLGGRATVGKKCHIGAGAVLAGVVEPASATPVVDEDNVLRGFDDRTVKLHKFKNETVLCTDYDYFLMNRRDEIRQEILEEKLIMTETELEKEIEKRLREAPYTTGSYYDENGKLIIY